MIVRAHAMGNQWQSVALLLPGRTGNDVKNRWKSKRMHLVSHGQMATRSSELSMPADPGAPACHKDLGGAAHDPEKVAVLRDSRSSEQDHNPEGCVRVRTTESDDSGGLPGRIHQPRSQAASTSEELALSSDPGWQELDPEKVSKLRGSFARVLPQPASAREDAVGLVHPQHSPATIASTLQSNPGVGVDISSKPSGQKGCGTRISGAEIGHVSQVWIHENRRAFQQ